MNVRWVSGGKERARRRIGHTRGWRGGREKLAQKEGRNDEQDERQKKVEDGATAMVVEEACVPNDVCTPRHVNDISGG